MNESILNSQGLYKLTQDRRYRFQHRLTEMTKPVSFQGNFVGVGFRSYESVMDFISVIPEESRRLKTRNIIDTHLKPMHGYYVLGAAHIDQVLDVAAGVI